MSFGPEWIIYIPSIFIIIFLILILLKTIFKDKLKHIEETTNLSTSGVGIISTILTICLACTVPILGFFGFLFNFPPEIVALLLGGSLYVIGDLIIKWLEKSNKTFFLHTFIINTLLITFGVVVLFVLYVNNTEHTPDFHIHADLKVFDNNQEINLYTPENIEKNKFFHFHDGKNQENVIHFEGKKGSLKDFLQTINFKFAECGNYTYLINGYINIIEYVVEDLDKLLLSCNSPATQEMIKSIGSNACIQSKKC